MVFFDPTISKDRFLSRMGLKKNNDVVWNITLMQTLDVASKIKIYRPLVNRFDCVNLWYEIEYES